MPHAEVEALDELCELSLKLTHLVAEEAQVRRVARRAILNQAASFAAAAALLPLPAIADLGDLDMGEAPPPVAMKVESLAIEPAADSGGGVALTMVDAGVKKKKEDTPASRIKELKAKGSLTDKERKELKRLVADEMCEMLGRGC